MEELDFEDVLLIHPDEDTKKIEAVEIDDDLNIHSDENTTKIEAVEIDDNLNIHPDDKTKKIESIQIDDSNEENASDSDSGEIEDDEEVNDLEEGEIKDGSPVSKKKADIACRFFKRGSCAFGSQCQFLHVSDTVYKMFDTSVQRRNGLQHMEPNDFHKPIIFPPNILPPRPFIKPLNSAPPKVTFNRPSDTFEDSWEKGLETAKILIEKANLKKKSEESEPKKFDFKNSKGEKGQHIAKRVLGNELDLPSKKSSEKESINCSSKREDTFGEKRSNYRYHPKSSDMWVDPWRRSKSPLTKKRQRSLSVSPSRARKHSYASSSSSMSSSSSEFDGNYERPYKRRSSRSRQRFACRSQSISPSRCPKRQRMSPKHSFNGKKHSKFFSRSFSRSPYGKRISRSGTRSRSSSCSSCSDRQESPALEDDEMQRISARLSEQLHEKSQKRSPSLSDSDCVTSELTVSSASCTSLSSDSEPESPSRSTYLRTKMSPLQNNASCYSNKTASQTKTETFNRNRSKLLKDQNVVKCKVEALSAPPKKVQVYNHNQRNLKTEPTDYRPKNTASNLSSATKPTKTSGFSKNNFSDMELLFRYQNLKPSNKNLNNVPVVELDKPSNNNSKVELRCENQSVKKTNKSNHKKQEVGKSANNSDAELLLRYQGIKCSDKNSGNAQEKEHGKLALKPFQTKDAEKITNKAGSLSESHKNKSKMGVVPKQNIILNLKPKSKDNFKPQFINEPPTIQKETASKREQLLNRLKLIDDAIARRRAK